MRARLIQFRDIAPEVRHFFFDVPELERFDFTPGQFVSFHETVLGKPVTRAYSIASAPALNRFELVLNRVKEGIFSPWLFDMQPGATVETMEPLGFFVPRTPFRESLFIATGTGIAPFRAYLQWEPVLASGCPITLLFGARYEASLLFRGEFEQLERTRPGFRFVPTLSRPSQHWTARKGWVREHVDELLNGRTDLDVYICGLRTMVDDVRERLKRLGLERERIVYERYD